MKQPLYSPLKMALSLFCLLAITSAIRLFDRDEFATDVVIRHLTSILVITAIGTGLWSLLLLFLRRRSKDV